MSTAALNFTAINERQPDLKWQQRFHALWPRYRAWFTKACADHPAPSPTDCRQALIDHCPELLPTYDRLCELAGDDPTAWQFLSFYGGPPLISGCSVTVLVDDQPEPVLLRNYDFSPLFFEGTVLHSRWSQRRVIAMTESFWGALDGVNDAGLAAALTFGGRAVHGKGFAVPLLLRYLLETCDTVKDAAETLMRLPVDNSHNIMLLDRHGDFAVVYIAPDQAPLCQRLPVTTNHQPFADRDSYCPATRTFEREAALLARHQQTGITPQDMMDALLTPPLLNRDYGSWLGHLYSVVYRPASGTAEYFWPGEPMWHQSFTGFQTAERIISLGDPV